MVDTDCENFVEIEKISDYSKFASNVLKLKNVSAPFPSALLLHALDFYLVYVFQENKIETML